jgi:hypothetical protein
MKELSVRKVGIFVRAVKLESPCFGKSNWLNSICNAGNISTYGETCKVVFLNLASKLALLVFSGPPTNQALGCAIVPATSCRAGKFTSRTLM